MVHKKVKTNKLISLPEAVSHLSSGQWLALGGMTLYRRPVAFVNEVIKQNINGIHLLAFTAGYESDLLVGSGCIDSIRTCYFGLEYLGLAPMFTKNSKRIKIIEETEATIAFGLKAKMAGTSFMPAMALTGTDLLHVRSDLKRVDCPYTGHSYVAVPAIDIDVAVIHAVKADANGNCCLFGEHCIDKELALAAHKVIITAEEIVPAHQLQEVDILGESVDYVVKAANGAYPTSCYPLYPVDFEYLIQYVEMCSEGQFSQFIAEAIVAKGDGE